MLRCSRVRPRHEGALCPCVLTMQIPCTLGRMPPMLCYSLPPLVEDAPLPDEPPSAGQRAPGAGVLDPPDACPPSAKPSGFRLLKPRESTKEISISNKKLSQRAVTVDLAGFDLHGPLWRTSEVLSACLDALWRTSEVLSACLDAAAAEPSKWDSAAIEGLRKVAGKHLASWCLTNRWPIVRDEALPVATLPWW